MNDSDKKLNVILQEIISSLVHDEIKDHFEGKKPPIIFENIEDYNQKTGKRFRMTKTQKEKGLSREEAFKESFGNSK